jgi:hypothetical protein
MTKFGQCPWERADDISEAAGFGKWDALRSGKCNMHEDLLRACAAE